MCERQITGTGHRRKPFLAGPRGRTDVHRIGLLNRSVLQLDAEPLRHAVERPPVDAEDLGGAGPIAVGGVEHVQQVAALEIVEGRQIGKRLLLGARPRRPGRCRAGRTLRSTSRGSRRRGARSCCAALERCPARRAASARRARRPTAPSSARRARTASSRKLPISSGMSARRSRSGGTRMTMTLSR